MGRIAKFFGRAAPLVGGYFDYQQSKAEGDDDIRAIANATGSTAGGWAGGEAGFLGGAALGTLVLPGIGTAIGGGIGGIGGAIAGSGVGRWLTGSTDEILRGKQMQHYDRNGNFIGDDGNPEPDAAHNVANLAAGGVLAGTGVAAASNAFKYGSDPRGVYNAAKGLGTTAGEATNIMGRSMLSDAGRAVSRLPGVAKLAGGAALAYGADQMLGRPVEKAIDTLTGQRTNLDNDPVNRQKQQQLQQLTIDQDNGYDKRVSDAQLEQMNLNPNNRYIQEQIDRTYGRQKADEAFQYNRQKKDDEEHSRNKLSAELGLNLMSNWYNSADRVNQAMQTIGRASFT